MVQLSNISNVATCNRTIKEKGCIQISLFWGFFVFIGCAEPFFEKWCRTNALFSNLHGIPEQPSPTGSIVAHGQSIIQTFKMLQLAIRQWEKRGAYRFISFGVSCIYRVCWTLFEKWCRQNALFSTSLHGIPIQQPPTTGSTTRSIQYSNFWNIALCNQTIMT